MKLISMLKYVIMQNIRFANNEITISELQILLLKYAQFLEQPFTLRMFVPCDEDGNPIEEYDWVSPDGVKWEDYEKQLTEAKQGVLFEGFELRQSYLWNKDKLFMISDNYNESFANKKNIEWLVTQSGHEFILTESGKQQIGL